MGIGRRTIFRYFPSKFDIPWGQFDKNLEIFRQRMRLIFETPSLQAHSFLMYQRWRGVIAEYVAQRIGQSRGAALPITVGHASLGLALAAYDIWLSTEEWSLHEALDSSLSNLRQYLGR